MSVRVFYDILNQKGTPAMYTDTLANRPTYGFAGRLFISTDSGQIFEDTGTAWTLVADAGVGGGTLSSVCLNGNTTATGIVITAGGLSSNSITNTGITAGSVVYAGTGGLMSQSNSTFFWDSTNNRLGINNASPGAPLDVHGTGTQIQVNGTGSNNSYIQFQNAGVSKWRVGNNYNSAANSFDIFNNGLTNTPFSINSSTNAITLSANVTTTGIQNVQNGLYLGYASGGATALYTNIYGSTNGVNFALANGTGGANFIFQTLAGYNYTFPATTGTLALTSNLSSYLPLTGGTLTGGLNGTTLYLNTLSTGTTGLDVASDNISFRSDNLEGNKRQLLITMGSGTLIQFTAKGYGANYGTDLAFYTATTSGVNGSPAIYITGTNNRVGIKTGTPSYDLDVTGTGRFTSTLLVSGAATFSSSVTINQSSYSFGGGLNLLNWQFVQGGDNALYFAYSGTQNFSMSSAGQVAIGDSVNSAYQLLIKSTTSNSSSYALILRNSNPTNLFYVRSDNYINVGTGAVAPYNYGTTGRSAILELDGSFGYLVSTRESKANIKSISNIDFINKLNPVQFNYRKKDIESSIYIDEIYENINYGFIADEVEKVNIDLVFYNQDGSLAGVEYNNMIAILTKAIQELNEKLVRNNIN
jgi:hypothetical protein